MKNETNFIEDLIELLKFLSGKEISYMVATAVIFIILFLVVTNQTETRKGTNGQFIGWMLALIFVIAICIWFHISPIFEKPLAIFGLIGSFLFSLSTMFLLSSDNKDWRKIARAFIFALLAVCIESTLLYKNYVVGLSLFYGVLGGLCLSMMLIVNKRMKAPIKDDKTDSDWEFMGKK